jgi:transposase
VDNNGTGWAELVERLHALPIAAVGIEPSGGYERGGWPSDDLRFR